MLPTNQTLATRPTRLALAVAAAVLALSGAASAAEIDVGNPDLNVRLDNTIRYNVGVRTQKIDPRIVANNTYDESDLKFKRGAVMANRVDLLSELDAVYQKNIGFRVSAAGWFDNAYSDTSVPTNGTGYASSYYNDHYNDTVKRFYRGPSGEILDAFVFGRLNLDTVPVDIKLGRHTVYWGEGLLIPWHSLAYSEAPLDGRKAVGSPGIETKEVFLPIGQFSIKSQVTDDLSLAGQYFYEWRPTRLPAGGTYFAPADPFFSDPDRLALAPGPNGTIPQTPAITPKNAGNFGVSGRYNVPAIDSKIGLYYRRFDDYNPWFAPAFHLPTAAVTNPMAASKPTSYHLAYAQGVKVLGASLSTTGLGGGSIGAELSYRVNGELNTSVINGNDNEGARGNTWHAIFNSIYLLPATPVFDTGILIIEMAYNRLDKVTLHPESYNGIGYACPANTQDKSYGCSTKDYLGLAVLAQPQWLQVVPRIDLSAPIFINYGLHGNAPTSGGGNEKSLSYSLGIMATVDQVHEIKLSYSGSYATTIYNSANTAVSGGNGNIAANDKGYVMLTLKSGF